MPPIFLLLVKIAFLVILYLFVARAVRAVTLDVFGPKAERRRARPARAPTRPVPLCHTFASRSGVSWSAEQQPTALATSRFLPSPQATTKSPQK